MLTIEFLREKLRRTRGKALLVLSTETKRERREELYKELRNLDDLEEQIDSLEKTLRG